MTEGLKSPRPLPRKLSEAQVDAIRYFHAGASSGELARLFGVSPSLIVKIRAGKKHKRRLKDGNRRVVYIPPPPELVERMDLDVWFARRGAALLRGYAAAVEKWKKEGRFEEPRTEEWQVDDEFNTCGFATDTRGAAERIVARARKFLAENPVAKPAGRSKADKGGPQQRGGDVPAPELLYDPK